MPIGSRPSEPSPVHAYGDGRIDLYSHIDVAVHGGANAAHSGRIDPAGVHCRAGETLRRRLRRAVRRLHGGQPARAAPFRLHERGRAELLR